MNHYRLNNGVKIPVYWDLGRGEAADGEAYQAVLAALKQVIAISIQLRFIRMKGECGACY